MSEGIFVSSASLSAQHAAADGGSFAASAAEMDAALRAYRARALREREAELSRAKVTPTLRAYSGIEHLLSLLAPTCCALCDDDVRGVQAPICERCEASLQSRRTALTFGDVWSPFQHAEQARRAVSRLKYHGERWRGFQLAQYAALSWLSAFEDEVDAQDVLIPIPLTAQRIRSRGFNQAQVLVSGIQRRVRLRACTNTLWRPHADQQDQKHLSRQERLVRHNPFVVRSGLAKHTRVWLVDDVITTGTTLQQAAERLEEAGLKPVGAITLTYTR